MARVEDSTGDPSPVRMTDQIDSVREGDVRMINQYRIGGQVGKGQHGEVWLCEDTVDGNRQVAMKIVKRTNPRLDKLNMLRRKPQIPPSGHTPLTEVISETEKQIRKEIAIMKKCRHPHVVKLLEVIDDKLKSKIYMIMEYLGGGEIRWKDEYSNPTLRVDQTRRIFRDVALGLEYLHYQGIIHRDIKPANLLWSSDRQTVKITDFGVSHFSYAQHLAAVGKDISKAENYEEDMIFMDDSALSKTAGTPSFYAPEVISDDRYKAFSTDSLTNAQPLPRRQITKAIDIWALGVTLYCFLFGRVPFDPSDQSEFTLYRLICDVDWDVSDTMGSDRIPTFGRKLQKAPKDTEGYTAVRLLERLMEKDPSKRISLDQVKRSAWVRLDLPNPDAWLKQSAIDRVDVTEQDNKSAMTLAFRWLERSIGTLRKLRRRPPPPQSRSAAAQKKTHKQVRSEPNMRMVRHKSTTAVEERRRPNASPTSTLRRASSSKAPQQLGTQGVSSTSLLSGSQRQKTKRRSTILSSVTRSKSQLNPPSTAATPTQSRSSTPGPEYQLHHSPPSASPLQTHSPGNQTPQSRPRSRFSLQSLKNWGRWGSSSVSSTASPSPIDASSQTSFPSTFSPYPASSSRVVPVRSVPDVLQHPQPPAESSWKDRDSFHDNRILNSGLRASSWGDFVDYPRGSGDVYSLHSGNATDNEELIDSMQRVRTGITYVSSGNNWLMNSSSSIGTSRTSSGGELQNVFSSLSMSPRRVIEPPVSRHNREPSTGRPHTTSPLNQAHRYADTYDSDDSSVFDRGYRGPESRPGPSRTVSTEDDGEEDDEGDSDTSNPIEIVSRRSAATPRIQNRRQPEPSDD